ncbi:SIR2 family protein [Rhizobium sullae]|uniref:SIR2 family protein n=1 Tax=Rhizobium sullae TaxID=50338 RepID=A0ABY5XFJ3_RHISU|nr:SIR2 family protein [Rhizobium sullae]UWU13240.1 SIR2 family protein [Rhizobium sullae]
MIDLPPYDALALSLHHSPGVHAILVGSGLSRAAGIPTGWEITLDLIRRLAALDGITKHDEWAKWYRDKYTREPNYSEILDALASTPAERRAILHSYINAPEGDDTRRPTKAHHAIAQLVVSGAVRVIVTTNFDRLIENALREAGIEPTVIASDDAIAGATPLVHAECTVIKVHGDYLDARIKNTDAELAGYSPAMNALLDQVFDQFGLLAVGWSGEWDTALRSAILRAPSRRYPFYWAARGDVRGLAQDMLNQRGGRSFPIADADSFFVKLNETLEALKAASRPHPQSVEMAVALAKRYCRDDQFAMEWAEFLHAEVESVRKYVSGPDYPTANPTSETLNSIVATFMVRTEVLRRACLICGRWGTTEANRAVVRSIQSLSFAAESQGGYTWYINLREFGASIVFYWNLAGLIDREDWKAINGLQSAEIKADGRNAKLVSVLPFLSNSMDWKILPGVEQNRTPVSAYLARQFVVEARDIALAESRAEELFDRTEISICLGFAHDRNEAMKTSGIHFWTPTGRFIWRRSGEAFETELKRIDGLTDTDPFFKAGMLGGSKASAAPTLQAVREFRQRIGNNYW